LQANLRNSGGSLAMGVTLAGPDADAEARAAVRARIDPSRKRAGQSDIWLYALLGLLILASWGFSRLGLFSAGSDTGYWIGVTGGSCMLLLFTYPMRKHWRFMQRFGSGKPWFIAHMVLGVAGPTLILVHSTWHIGSINAGVALVSMLIVAISGVIGRFLYVRLHSDLHGHKLDLAALRGPSSGDESAATRLRFAPEVVAKLKDFETRAITPQTQSSRPALLHALVRVPWWRWQLEHECHEELKLRVLAVAKTEQLSSRRARRLMRTASLLVHHELMSLERIAQFSAMERLFSWWHIAHVPFVYLMVISAIAHVIAVHIY
jgi:hypothetical protein